MVKVILQNNMNIPILTEEQEQILLVNYLDILGIKYTHIASSTFTKSWKVKNRNKAMGVRPGLPDLVMIINDNVVFMELKRTKGGVLSPYQKEWIKDLKACVNVEVFVCAGFQQAKEVVDNLIKIL